MRALSYAVVGLLSILVCVPAHADPPTCPPPCDVELGPLFCIRVTDIERSPIMDDTWFFEFEFLNWTGTSAAGLTLTLNCADNPAGNGVAAGAPRFVGASIDTNGRPIGTASHPPQGNQLRDNLWEVAAWSESRVEFFVPPISASNPSNTDKLLPGVSAVIGGTTFNGILDPAFSGATQQNCVQALIAMIPGSTFYSNLGCAGVATSNMEAVDDGMNVLDGFVIAIGGWNPGEQLSFNWFLRDEYGDNMGMVVNGGPVLGDEYAFGTFNIARGFSPRGGWATSALHTPATIPPVMHAPSPLFQDNAGYNPPDNTDPDADSPRYFAEDEVGGTDTYPIMPIPLGEPGAGTYFHVEPGAAVTAEFADPADNGFLVSGGAVQAGVNLFPPPWGFYRGDCNGDGTYNIADPVQLLIHLFVNSSPVCGAPPPVLPCEKTCDANDDGNLNLSDVVVLLSSMFGVGWGPLPQPFPTCGLDPTPDDLLCENFHSCY